MNFLHYIPIATTLISILFLITLLHRARGRGYPPHLMWWAVGVFFYGLGTAIESTITLHGNTVFLTRLWYWAGAILGGYPLATGSVYLLHKRKVANLLTGASLLVVIAGTIGVFLTPMNAQLLNPAKPGGELLAWAWIRFPVTPLINIYAVIFLVGGAIQSSLKFFETPELRRRAYGTALIAAGAILPGIGGSLASQGIVEALYIGEFLGLILIWWGYELCTRAPKPVGLYVSDEGVKESPVAE